MTLSILERVEPRISCARFIGVEMGITSTLTILVGFLGSAMFGGVASLMLTLPGCLPGSEAPAS